MRIAAVALVLIVGAAVVLAFANTLNSWVLGGLLGGLAAILLSIPISLALFTLLARRQDARQNSSAQFFEDEPDFADDVYDEALVRDARGYLLAASEDFPLDPRAYSPLENRRLPVSGYLPLPPSGRDLESYEDDQERLARRDPRNYPRQPRSPARAGEIKAPPPANSRRNPSTRSLAQHQSSALRQAREEAQQQRSAHRNRPGSRTRRPQQGASPAQSSRSLRPQPPQNYHIIDEDNTQFPRQRGARTSWSEDEGFPRDLTTEQYPRRPAYPLRPRASHSRAVDPWTGALEDEDDQDEPGARRARRDSERMSGTLRNPLVRRAPYLYEDDPLRDEFAQQLDNGRPITRRSSLYGRYKDEEEY